MADEFLIPETQVLAVASHVGNFYTSSYNWPTDVTQGCVRVSAAIQGL